MESLWPHARLLLFGHAPAAAEPIVALLDAWGAEPTILFDLAAAVAALEVRRPQLALVDLGEGHGSPALWQETIELVRELRRRVPSPDGRPVPVVLLVRGPAFDVPVDSLAEDAWVGVLSIDDPGALRAALEWLLSPAEDGEALGASSPLEVAGGEVATADGPSEGDGDAHRAAHGCGEGVPESHGRPVDSTRRLWRMVLAAGAVVVLVAVVLRPGEERGIVGTPVPGGGAGVLTAGTGQDGVRAGLAASPANAAALAGTIGDRQSQAPLEGATVAIRGPSGSLSATTDAQGRWRIAGLQGGAYTVVVSATEYDSQQVVIEVPEGRVLDSVHLTLARAK